MYVKINSSFTLEAGHITFSKLICTTQSDGIILKQLNTSYSDMTINVISTSVCIKNSQIKENFCRSDV